MPVKLFLASPPASVGQRWRDRLARFLDLDVFGESLLFRRARGDMRIQAVLLVIVFVFDLGVWSLMANLILGAGAIGWYTALAVLAGLAMAYVFFAIERSIATLDIREHGQGPLLARALLILITATITAVPFELFLFQAPIDARVLDEAIRTKIASLHVGVESHNGALAELEARRERQTTGEQGRDDDTDIDARMTSIKSEIERLDDRITNLWVERRKLSAEDHSVDPAAIEAQIRGLEERRRSLTDERRALVIEKQDRKSKNWQAQQQTLKQLDDQIQHQRKLRDDERRKIAQLLTRDPEHRQAIVELVGDAAVTNDVFRRLRVLRDLITGVSPRWPDASEGGAEGLASTYSITETRPPEAVVYWWMWLFAGVFGVAVPCATLFFKLMTKKGDLADYYSHAEQLAVGHPEAVQRALARRRADAARAEAA
jgi:hypothetical protein